MTGLSGAALTQREKADAERLPVRLVAVDVGGTIVEEHGDIPAALRGAAKREVVEHFVSERRDLPTRERDRLVDVIYADFSARIIDSYQTVKGIPGAADTFREMRKWGLTLATSTGFDNRIASSILTRLGWGSYFAAQITSDDVARGRPSPYMLFHAMEAARIDCVSQIIAVGDTPLDLRAGMNNGMRSVVGVLSGAGKRDAMEREPHADLIDSVAALPALLHSKYGVG